MIYNLERPFTKDLEKKTFCFEEKSEVFKLTLQVAPLDMPSKNYLPWSLNELITDESIIFLENSTTLQLSMNKSSSVGLHWNYYQIKCIGMERLNSTVLQIIHSCLL